MKFKTALFYLSLFALLAMPTFAQKAKKKMTNSEKAEKILEKAMKNRISYMKTTFPKDAKMNSKQISWSKYYPDGTVVSRTERISSVKGQKVSGVLSLSFADDSQWVVIDNIAIEEVYIKNRMQKARKKRKKLKPEKIKFIYKMENSFYDKIPCFKITRKSIKYGSNVYYIDKKDFFVYLSQSYSKTGKKIEGWSHISKPVFKKMKADEIDDKLFEIPKHCKVIKAQSIDDFILYFKVAYLLHKKKFKIHESMNADEEKAYLKKYKVSSLEKIFYITTQKNDKNK